MFNPRTLSELDILACTIMGEAESEPFMGKLDVGAVIKNRVDAHEERYGLNWREVALRRAQFSCWTDKNALTRIETHRTADDAMWRLCRAIAEIVYTEQIPDLAKQLGLEGVCHYNSDYCDPKWDDNMILVKKTGHHEFFREKA